MQTINYFRYQSVVYALLGAVFFLAHGIATLARGYPAPSCPSSGLLLHVFVLAFWLRQVICSGIYYALSRTWMEQVPLFLQSRAAKFLVLGTRMLNLVSFIIVVFGYACILLTAAACRGSWLAGLATGALVLAHIETIVPCVCVFSLLCVARCCVPRFLPPGPARDQFMLEVFGHLPPLDREAGPNPLTAAQLADESISRLFTYEKAPQPAAEAAAAAKGKEEEEELCSICLSAFQHGEVVRELQCSGSGKGGHRFHDSCVSSWLTQQKPSCPVCRKSLVPEQNAPPQGNPPLTDEAAAGGNAPIVVVR
jgi:hypothetical protein